MNKINIKIRLILLICTASILIGTLSLPGTPGALNASESRELKTEFDTYSETKLKEDVTLKNGDVIAVQFHTLAPTVSFSLATESDDNEREFTVDLFNWDENLKKTLRGKALGTWTVSEWAKTGEIFIDFTTLDGGSLGAGEYALRFRLDKGSDVVLKRYKPAPRGFN